MKHGWIILGLLLLLIASVSLLIYLLVEGVVMRNILWALLVWLLTFVTLALVAGIAWLAGWLPRKEQS